MRAAALLVTLAMIAGCAAADSTDKPGSPSDDPRDAASRDVAVRGDAGFMEPPVGGGAGSGGSSGSAGAAGGGGRGGGSGGSAGSGAVDAGVADGGLPGADAGGFDAGPPRCSVLIRPISPPSWDAIVAGPTSRVRVSGELMGSRPDAAPAWAWTVYYPNGTVERPMPASADMRNVIDIPATQLGRYQVDVTAGADCAGRVVFMAESPQNKTAQVWLRVIPPRAAPAIPAEQPVMIRAGTPAQQDVALNRGELVKIDPINASRDTVQSYILVTSPESTLRLEGNSTGGGAFEVWLDPLRNYSVLVLPGSANDPLAPRLFAPAPPRTIALTDFTVDRGVAVSGTVATSSGPLQGARVILRAGAQPSTVGVTGASGAFSLRAAEGGYSALIVPPRESTLPEASINNEAIFVDGVVLAGLSFRYAPMPMRQVALSVELPGGGSPGRELRVRIETDTETAPVVGTLSHDGSAVSATGKVRVERTTDTAGRVTLPLPLMRYRVTVVPPSEMTTVAITTSTVTVTSGAGAQPAAIRLARRVTASGSLQPTARAADGRVIAVDRAAELGADLRAATVTAQGTYDLLLDPGRAYRLYFEPAGGRDLPRAHLGEVTAPATDGALGARAIPTALPLTGRITLTGAAVPGATVQAFCIGERPDCVELRARDRHEARPLAEAVSGPTGEYRLLLPDPGTGN